MVKKRNECTEKRIGGFVFVGSRDWLGIAERERERERERETSVLVKLE